MLTEIIVFGAEVNEYFRSNNQSFLFGIYRLSRHYISQYFLFSIHGTLYYQVLTDIHHSRNSSNVGYMKDTPLYLFGTEGIHSTYLYLKWYLYSGEFIAAFGHFASEKREKYCVVRFGTNTRQMPHRPAVRKVRRS